MVAELSLSSGGIMQLSLTLAAGGQLQIVASGQCPDSLTLNLKTSNGQLMNSTMIAHQPNNNNNYSHTFNVPAAGTYTVEAISANSKDASASITVSGGIGPLAIVTSGFNIHAVTLELRSS